MAALNPRQLKFIELYLATGNATQSYIDAGYSADRATAEANAARLLGNDKVREVIDKERAKANEKQGISAEWYAERVKMEAERTGDGSSHGARVAALRLASELLGVGTATPPAPPEGLSFDAVMRIIGALESAQQVPGDAAAGSTGIQGTGTPVS